jgi:hypothetical protein
MPITLSLYFVQWRSRERATVVTSETRPGPRTVCVLCAQGQALDMRADTE